MQPPLPLIIAKNNLGDGKMDVFAKHQIRIAKRTLELSDIGASIMGGMTKDEARAILKRHGIKFFE